MGLGCSKISNNNQVNLCKKIKTLQYNEGFNEYIYVSCVFNFPRFSG